MGHVESLSKYVTHFVDQLASSGVEHVVISPGSRSTPLAMTFAEHSEMEHWVHLDERSAAFFALGIAKREQKPVAVVCTSGTAAANYYPAIVEAYYSRVPLLILTADRPHELREVGAPQAINQIQMFGNYVKWYQDLALPEPGNHIYARRQASRAVEEAKNGHMGPVHLNFPFREPLIPDFHLEGCWREEGVTVPRASYGKRMLDASVVSQYLQTFAEKDCGLIVVGPQMDPDLAEAVTRLASRLGVPVLADPLSQLRAGTHDKRNIMENYDSLLKSEALGEELIPGYILRFGAMPVSKAYLKWVQKFGEQVDHFVADEHPSHREPAGIDAHYIWADPVMFCEQLADHLPEDNVETEWLSRWQEMNNRAKSEMLVQEDESLNEGHAVVYLADSIPNQSNLFIGNSMPIRDVDSFFMSTPKQVRMMANRGANGIDGVISAAAGTTVSGERTTLLIGDVSFFHDMNGLWLVKHKKLPLTIVVINNDGGGIFSYLPQSKQQDHFEELFGTPLGLDLSAVTALYDGRHHVVETWDSYRHALAESYKKEGLSVIEVRTDRSTHVDFHKEKWAKVEASILSGGSK